LGRGISRLINEKSRKRPCFSGCWTSPCPPQKAVELERYDVLGSTVSISSLDDGAVHLYHVTPWEHLLPDEWVSLLSRVINKVSTIPPDDIGASYGDLRGHVLRTASRLLREDAARSDIELGADIASRESNISRLAEAAARHTVGLGVLEVLLADDRVEDVYVDAPSWENPVHVTLNGIQGSMVMRHCTTNIISSGEETDRMAARFKQYSGRPFSEAYPVMETDVQGHDARATVIGPPLSPSGTAIALRRHSAMPWTLLRLAYAGALDAWTAGLLSFLIDGRCTMLVSGARGAGKSSMLAALMFEFPLSQRILAIEDTLELPVRRMQTLGYKVQSLMMGGGGDHSAEEGAYDALRVSLRLGESAIVLGEVRGREAGTLYESMRAGRAGSSVLGTIHGDSARSVYDRVVHDMGIAKEAFMATDVVVTMGLTRPGGSSKQVRRLAEAAETARSRGPGEFNAMVTYDAAGDAFIRGGGEWEAVRRIAASWSMTYEGAMRNIDARARMRSALLSAARSGGMEYLGPEWTCRCNEHLRRCMDEGGDLEASVESFRAYVSRRCGHEVE